MLCMLVNIFRDKPIKEEFDTWPVIQSFISHNVNKFSQEVLQIKNKVLEKINAYPLEQFRRMKEEFF